MKKLSFPARASSPILLALLLLGATTTATAQTPGSRPMTDIYGHMGIGTIAPDKSAILDLSTTTAGFLMPRLTSAERNALVNPAVGLMVYNTDTKTIEFNIGTTFAPIWDPVVTTSSGSGLYWQLLGNSGTNPAINFIGTTDGQPLVVRTNSVERLRVATTGEVGIGTAAPTAGRLLEVAGTAGVANVRLASVGGLGSGTPLGGSEGILIADGNGDLSKRTLAAISPPSWVLTGNSGTTAGANFLGTVDSTAFEIKIFSSDPIANRGSQRVMLYEPTALSPNITGGYQGNVIDPGMIGGVIAGGGVTLSPNRITGTAGISGGFATIGGGIGNTTSQTFATIAGGKGNTASEVFATIGGGDINTASGIQSTVGGGSQNTASGTRSTVSGGASNMASGTESTVGGGISNLASDTKATVAGGGNNTASGIESTIGGGYTNTANNTKATVAGGGNNSASGIESTVGGGYTNTASNIKATVAGGSNNIASGVEATVSGGHSNDATSTGATIGGGQDNQAFTNPFPTISGGADNRATGTFTVISGGRQNGASGAYASVSSGELNGATGSFAHIGGGQLDSATGPFAVINGGSRNYASAAFAYVGSGQFNNASAAFSVINGGFTNQAAGAYTTVGGGDRNNASFPMGTISGGRLNTVSGVFGAIGGGESNSIIGTWGVVGGGKRNVASGSWSVIGGGDTNAASGTWSVVGGGDADTALGSWSTIGGGQRNKTIGAWASIGGGLNNVADSLSAIPGGQSLKLGGNSFGFNADTTVPTTVTDLSAGAFRSSAYFGNADVLIGNIDNNARDLRFYEPNTSFNYSGTNFTAFQAQTQGGNITYTLPASAAASNGDILTSTTGGVMQWSDADSIVTANAWGLLGNAGTTAGTNFVGTTDDEPFEIHVDEAGTATEGRRRVMRFEPNATSANIIGGFSGNIVGGGVVGATVSGGGSSGNINQVMGNYGTIGGGVNNTASGFYSLVGGGRSNTASGDSSTVGGGYGNHASGFTSTVGGGFKDTASANFSIVGGGGENRASGINSTVSGGFFNTASSLNSTVGGGLRDTASGSASTVGGGEYNTASQAFSTVGGGGSNTASGFTSTVGGGYTNTASGPSATVGGGSTNTASGITSTVGGGSTNRASGNYGVVGGGSTNTASGNVATVGGGFTNTAAGDFSAIPGGRGLTLNGAGSFGFLGGNTGFNDMTISAADVAVFGNTDLWLANNDNAPSELRFFEAYNTAGAFPNATANFTAFKAQDQTGDITYTLPASNGTAGQVLSVAASPAPTAATATLEWATASSGWSLTGNAGTTAGTNFIGTTDNVAFEIRVNNTGAATGGNQRVMRYESGTSSPNIIGGFNGNTITTSSGSAIGSGGSNGATAINTITGTNFGVIAGGTGNRILTSTNAIIGAGLNDSITGSNYSVVGGGNANSIVSANSSVIPGGNYLKIGSNSFGFNGLSTAAQTDISGFSSVAYFGNAHLMIGNIDGTAREVRFYEPNTVFNYPVATNYTGFKSQAQTTNITYTLPAAAPTTTGQILSATTGGTMSWVDGPTLAQAFTNNSSTTPTLNLTNSNATGTALQISDGKMVVSTASYASAATIGGDVVAAHVNDNGVGASAATITLPTGVAGQILYVSTADPDGVVISDGVTTIYTLADDDVVVTLLYIGGKWKPIP